MLESPFLFKSIACCGVKATCGSRRAGTRAMPSGRRVTENVIMAGKQTRRRPGDHVRCKLCDRKFRAITYLHLRNIHDYDGDHPVNDYKREFRLQTATCAVSRKKISEKKEEFWARRGQHWTSDTLLA